MPLLLEEIANLITLLEADIPANPNSPKNQKLEKRVEKVMERYFKKLELAMPQKEIAKIYNRYVEKE